MLFRFVVNAVDHGRYSTIRDNMFYLHINTCAFQNHHTQKLNKNYTLCFNNLRSK